MIDQNGPNRTQTDEIASLRRQVRWLQGGMLALFGLGLIAAAPITREVIRTKGIIIEDDQGHDRILIGAPAPGVAGRRKDVTTSMVFRSATGADRVIVGEQPNPVAGGKVYPRISPAWGLTLYNSSGNERGGLANLDIGRSSLSLDRSTADAIGMMVDEKSGFAGLIMNYEGGQIGKYPTAIQMGTVGSKAFIQASNMDGSPAGAMIAGASGRAKLAETAGQ
jgi:hypothetical protein